MSVSTPAKPATFRCFAGHLAATRTPTARTAYPSTRYTETKVVTSRFTP